MIESLIRKKINKIEFYNGYRKPDAFFRMICDDGTVYRIHSAIKGDSGMWVEDDGGGYYDILQGPISDAFTHIEFSDSLINDVDHVFIYVNIVTKEGYLVITWMGVFEDSCANNLIIELENPISTPIDTPVKIFVS